ncbi:MAG: hypothetical protein KAG66_00470 [Methylococcales bacterium]|nr:hypothetical protein [Methylococcales bacterium]
MKIDDEVKKAVSQGDEPAEDAEEQTTEAEAEGSEEPEEELPPNND